LAVLVTEFRNNKRPVLDTFDYFQTGSWATYGLDKQVLEEFKKLFQTSMQQIVV
jgi:hypothetical protein